MKHIAPVLCFLSASLPSVAQGGDFVQHVTMQGSFSQNKTPLWLNANKYGLSSLTESNGHVGYGALYNRNLGEWELSIGSDIYLPAGYRYQGYQEHYTSHIIVQQAFMDVSYKNIYFSLGAKERPLTLRNNWLSSGSHMFGKNARPVPQIRFGLNDYWILPYTKQWLAIKGHLSFGVMTDGEWESAFAFGSQWKYNRMTRYHEKAGYLRITHPKQPWNFVGGLEMASQFGGTLYNWKGTDQNNFERFSKLELASDLSSYKNAFLCTQSADVGESTFKNTEGNIIGSWVLRFEWNADNWKTGIYHDHVFEDHSGMGYADYDGYGSGEEWNVRKENRWFAYKPLDAIYGFDLELKNTKWVKNFTLEYIHASYQSGPIYHDHNQSWSDHVCGIDDYYNHSRLPGWQHWGQIIGNPLYRSPQYNTNGYIGTSANRFNGWHAGMSGNLHPMLAYRCLLSYQKSWGTYLRPFVYPQENTSLLLEANADIQPLYLTIAYAQDWGKLLGNNHGIQITLKYNIQ